MPHHPPPVDLSALLESGTLPVVQAILDAIPAPIFFKDAAGVYRGCNQAFERWVGRPRAEIIGRTVEDVAPPELAAIYRRADDALLAAPGVQVYETAISTPDGRRDVQFHKSTFEDPSGRVAGLVGTYLDITDVKRAERALRESEARLQLVLDATDQVSWDWDVPTGRVVAGPQARRLLGVEPEALGTLEAALALVHPADAAPVREAMSRRLRADATFEVECRVRHQDGSWRWFLVVARVVERDEARRPRRVVGAAVDVSESKALHERLVVSDRLAALGTLAAGLAHEINNPLTYVGANVEFAAETLRELGAAPCRGSPCDLDAVHPAVPEVRKALAEAEEGIARVSQIVRDLRVFSHPGDVGGGADAVAVARSSANIVRSELRGRGLTLRLAPIPPVAADAARLGQVIVNLLVNAAQALPPEGGEVTLSTRPAADGWVAIEVTDTGPGIPPELRARIFEPFFTTKPPGEGTGLGLFVCHRLVSAMGGEIQVESAPGRGTTFRVLLPVASARAAAEPASSPSRAPRRRVLVVDDEPSVARAVERALSPEHDVVTAAGGAAALDRVASGDRFDAIVCDVMMPGMDGQELHARLRERDPALAARMVFMTGGGFHPRVRAFLDAVGNGHVLKPFRRDALARAVDEAARRSA